jgi:hypothetical protein
MAHRSKKKHLKHVHEHEPVTPPAKSPISKAAAAEARFARPRAAAANARARAAGARASVGAKASGARAAVGAKAASVKSAVAARRVKKAKHEPGILRTVAHKATAKLAAKPKKIIKHASRRVRSLLAKDSNASRS